MNTSSLKIEIDDQFQEKMTDTIYCVCHIIPIANIRLYA